ncbi:unnamed protein product [Brassica rapa subsp. narinosa]
MRIKSSCSMILEVERVVKKASFHAEDTLHKEADVPKEADIKEMAKKTPKRSLATVAGGKYVRTLRLHFFNRPNDSELVLEVESTETSEEKASDHVQLGLTDVDLGMEEDHYKKTAAYRGKKSSVCRRNNTIPTTYRRNKSSEITPRKFIFPRKFSTEFQGNEFPRKLRGPPVCRKGPRNIPREDFLGIFRWNFRWSNPRKFRRNVSQNFHREFPRNGALGKF